MLDAARAGTVPGQVFARIRRLSRESPAFACYLLAVAVLPFRWLSPITSVQEHGSWTDLLIGVAAVLWVLDRTSSRTLLRSLRTWQLPLAVYLGLAAISAELFAKQMTK